MKIKTSLFAVFMSFLLIISLTSCDLITAMRENAEGLKEVNEGSLPEREPEETTDEPEPVDEPEPTDSIIEDDQPDPQEPVSPESPAENPDENTEDPEPLGKEFRHMGLSFTIPAGLDYEVSLEEVDEAEDPSALFPGQIGAAHIIFHLNPQTPVEHIMKAKIMVFPMDSFMNVYVTWQTDIATLNLLRSSGDFSGYNPLEALPFPPIFGAMQMYHAKEKGLTFQNGSGIRFLTEYGQAYSPMATESLFYAFVGVTEDQNYIVVGTIPMGQSPLPEKVVWPSDMDAFYAQYDQLATNAAQLLNRTQDHEFSPNLELLDKMFESLRLSIQ